MPETHQCKVLLRTAAAKAANGSFQFAANGEDTTAGGVERATIEPRKTKRAFVANSSPRISRHDLTPICERRRALLMTPSLQGGAKCRPRFWPALVIEAADNHERDWNEL